MENVENINVAVVYEAGLAIFAEDLIDLTFKAFESGINLTGLWIRKARLTEDESGVWVEGGCEDKHYLLNGKIDN